MPANRPNKETTLQREITSWDLRCRGKTCRAIAEVLGITRQAVDKALDRVEGRELKRLSKRVERTKVRNHNRLDEIVEAAFDAWFRSTEPLKRASRKTRGAGGSDEGDAGVDEVTSTDVIEQTGDVRYLHLAMDAMDRQAKLWGLEVLPAQNERVSSISSLVEDIKARANKYEAGKASEDADRDPARASGPDQGGAEGVPE